ncbi:GGDEF domain-containing protein [Alteromonas sp. McT4-15]|uniref:GGDEF domain-containing protein n=1 Tax=Alteromonas sp. McT4-15 TaxID=2881256 RepID=UPI001CF8A30B|nr:diguanylate cyclase [Alteromonas sp. McT4-15]MCB4437760.1 GGDEF domain-containing protein [Alteromonas sp. McT4-15]
MANKKKTLQFFVLAQCSVMGLFLFILAMSIFRLDDVRKILSDVATTSIPTLSQATEITREVQHLISLTARLTASENQSSRRIVKAALDDSLNRLRAPIIHDEFSDKYLMTQLSVLVQEIDELNALVTQRIDVEKEVSVEREALFDYLNSIFEGNDEQFVDLQHSKMLVSLILQIAQINQQFQLHELRLLEGNIENSIAQLRATSNNSASSQALVSSLEEAVLDEWGMIDKQANVMRIRGRSRGRGSFVEHLAEEVASNIEYRTASITQATYEHADNANRSVTKQISLSLALSLIVMLICCAIIFYIYKRIILRLIALTNLVENDSEAVKSQEAELINLSLSDALTNIPNRRAFELEIEKSRAMAKRHKWPLTVLMIDVDHFKAYNDHYGHTQGDACLKKVAKGLNKAIARNTDFCARYGGEEFVAIMPNTDQRGAGIKAEEAREIIEQLHIAHAKSNVSDYITVSIGAATFYFDEQNDWQPDTLLNLADNALYQAKNAGRNRCVFIRQP